MKKFKADVPLWLEWIAYAKSQGSSKCANPPCPHVPPLSFPFALHTRTSLSPNLAHSHNEVHQPIPPLSEIGDHFCVGRVLSKIFARALQIHPRDASLWIHAAAWEFEENRNVTAARSLLQRGLRLNGKSRDMWREYFKMEVLFVTRLIERRRILGLDGQDKEEEEGEAEESGKKGAKGKGKGKGKGKAAIDIPDLDEEAEKEGEEGGKMGGKGKKAVEEPEGLKDLLEGSIPLVVLRFVFPTWCQKPKESGSSKPRRKNEQTIGNCQKLTEVFQARPHTPDSIPKIRIPTKPRNPETPKP